MLLSKTINPATGDAIATRCAVVILGIRIPFVVLLMSSCADASGVDVPMPTDWPKTEKPANQNRKMNKSDFFMPGDLDTKYP